MQAKTVAIVGLNRIGASVGLALKQASPQLTLIGQDDDYQQAKAAQNLGAVDKVERALRAACSQADIIILNVPLPQLEAALSSIGGHLQAHTLLLDLCLLKSAGLAWAKQYLKQGYYVGVRPILAADFLADGRSGLEAASPTLFSNSIFCLTAEADTDAEAVQAAIQVGKALGAVPYFLDAAEFDGLAQGIEILPRLTAVALFNTITKSPSWRDTRRLADLTFAQATASLADSQEIAMLATANKATTQHWLNQLISELQQIQQWLHHEEDEVFSAILAATRIDREKWLGDRSQNNWQEESPENIKMPSLLGNVWRRQPK